ncbi:MAG: hypothetical protein VZQ84_01010 [Anaerovoracaceae bacterium]|nr:hypothetical protein [Anaerovoracaceae bacterium]
MKNWQMLIDLQRLKASKFDPEYSPEQHKFYSEYADWLETLDLGPMTFTQLAEKQKGTKFEDLRGATVAYLLDDARVRAKANEEIGFDNAAAIYRNRYERILKEGADYPYTQEAMNELGAVAQADITDSRRNETCRNIFYAYFTLRTDLSEMNRKTAAGQLDAALAELSQLGFSFDELAGKPLYRNITGLTEEGMDEFAASIHRYMESGELPAPRYSDDLEEETERAVKWAMENAEMLRGMGSQEQLKRGGCIAVPSDDPLGYDFIERIES